MSRRDSLKGEDDKIDVNISPLIDMVFILLIFFIVTTVFVDEEGFFVDRPEPNPDPTPLEEEPFLIHLSDTGQVMMDGQEVGLGAVRPRVAARMRAGQVPVIVQVGPQTRSSLMIQVMDEAKLADAEMVSVTTRN